MFLGSFLRIFSLYLFLNIKAIDREKTHTIALIFCYFIKKLLTFYIVYVKIKAR